MAGMSSGEQCRWIRSIENLKEASRQRIREVDNRASAVMGGRCCAVMETLVGLFCPDA